MRSSLAGWTFLVLVALAAFPAQAQRSLALRPAPPSLSAERVGAAPAVVWSPGAVRPRPDRADGAAPGAPANGENVFCSRSYAGWDVRGVQAVYCDAPPVVAAVLQGAHRTAYPVFYGGLPAAWAGARLFRDNGDYTDAYRLTVTQVTTYALVMAGKRAVGRPRPYVTLPLTSRSSAYADGVEDGAYASFPSGHASLSTALATSWSLSHPTWYVIAPSALWAGAVTASRVHLGVHYPSDVLAGAVLGAGVATAVHLLRDAITPDAVRPDDPMAGAATPMVTVRIGL